MEGRPKTLTVIKLRRDGASIRQIAEKLHISVSTVKRILRSHGDFGIGKDELELIRQRTRSATIQAKTESKWRGVREKAARHLGPLTDRDLLLLGIGIFWSEGTKKSGQLEITNTDPQLLRTCVKWLQMLGIKLEEITIQINMHDDLIVEDVTGFWAGQLGLGLNQFRNPTILPARKHGSHRQKAQYGVCKLRVAKSSMLLNRVLGFIEAISGQSLPVRHRAKLLRNATA